MRNFGKTILVLFLSAVAVCIFAQQPPRVMNIKFKKVGFIDPPRFQTSGSVLATAPTGSAAMKWFVVLVEYELSSPGAKKRNAEVAYIKNLDVELYVSVPGRADADVSPQILITGSQKLWMVRTTGKKHHVLFAIPPQIFEQFVSKKTNGKGVSAKVLVRFMSGPNDLGWNGFGTEKEDKKKVASVIGGLKNNRMTFKVEGGALPKEKTPWQWVNSEAYDLPASLFEGIK